ncbi:sulfite exporter TauE/SafE family protein 2-like [Hordeum vulgare subsp. vulgare]|uniref:Sulfite exporter TauE/SafE family protein n=1 Tax=Hordeum vulgare subsp. vulgare TaxID=112509 RepID=A0A8I6YAJ9_HORVV|nr:sulfite exporter TauE/SafE family protein 2-like [Hordeum vulgare subsp. vulgare]
MDSSSSQLLTAATAANSTFYLSQWRSQVTMGVESSLLVQQSSLLPTVLACILSFLAATMSSAAGVGGGSLYVPILNIVAGLSLKTSTAFSTFMVTGGTLSNVLYTLLARGPGLIDYDVAVVSQPCLLLGVSIGVVCNVMFPEWLITVLFTGFLSLATFKTYGTGLKRWRAESAATARGVLEGASTTRDGTEEALLIGRKEGATHGCHWVDLTVLFTVWLCFFVIHLFIGGEGAKGAFDMKPCGLAYWLITVAQIPVAVAFTACIVQQKGKSQTQKSQVVELETSAKSRLDALPVYVFPVAALLTGVMSGLFGIGGGLLLNPALLHIGVPPKTASATTMFMVLFCASMSMVQFIILGVDGIVGALVYAITCFVASIVGLVVIEGAVRRSGRVSLIVLMVAAILALSAIVIACSGGVHVWAQYTSGQYMGFKLPC